MTTALQDAIDHTALGWVKPEIDETLRQARIELEGFAENPGEALPMDTCMGHLHQVQGTLQMLELQAPAMVAGEMEQLAAALREGVAADRDEALAVLMRGMVQLPDYLERLQGGHRDIPIVLLPLINELRAARGVSALGQEALPSLLEAPTEAELEHARGSLAGRNRALLDTVSTAIKEDLLKVKDALDLHLRGSRDNVQDLQAQAEALDRIGDTLGMLGLDSARGVVQEQCRIVHDIASGVRPPAENDLLEVAGALLYIDHSLDDQVAQLGSGSAEGDAGGLLAQESRKVMGALTRAAVTNFAEVRNAFVAFVETDWSHSALESVPRLLAEVAGAMRMLERPEPAGYLEALRRYSQVELIDRAQVPGGRQLDTLADALSSMEYFLETLHDPHGQRLDLLEKTRASLEALHYWPLPEPSAVADKPMEDVTATAEAGVGPVPGPDAAEAVVEAKGDEVAEEEQVSAPAEVAVSMAPAVVAVAAGFESAGDEIDDEIREIFLEEFEDEINNLDGLLPAWKLTPDDADTLRPIRRVFHTLKGSGRLVGAKVLGEFAWHVENMLNRVLDGSRPASHAVVAYVGQARSVLPQLHAALRGDGAVTLDIPAMEAIADRLAAGEDVVMSAPPVTQAAPSAPVQTGSAVAPAVAAEADMRVVAVDPVLLEILCTEVGGHLETVDAWLAQARSGDAAATDALVRAIHTLNGAFAMTEVPTVTAFTTPAEGYAKRLLAAHAIAGSDGVAALGAVAEAVRASTRALKESPGQVPVFEALAERMVALRDALPEASLPFVETGSAAQSDAEQAEAERFAAEEVARQQAERIAAEEAEAARVAAEQAEVERLAAEEAARREAERIAAEEAEAARVAAEQAEVERLAAEEAARQEAERIAAEEAEAARVAAEQAEAARLAAEQAEAERVAAEDAERQAAAEAELLEIERIAAEEAEAARLAAEQAEAERVAAEEAARRDAERLAASRPAIGASIMMNPMIVPRSPSFINVSLANDPK